MTISVLTLVKNRAGHLDNLVEGLIRSGQQPDELVIVDMSDIPVTVVSTPFPSRVVRLETTDLPLAQARNLAARHASGDHLLFLDVDCIPMADLVRAMDSALSHQDALICAEVRYLGPDAVLASWTEPELMRSSQPHPARSFPATGLRKEDNAGLFWSLTFGLHQTTFARLGGFDERFTGYGAEDTDFGFRSRDSLTPLMFMGGAGAFHQHHDVYDPQLQHFEDILRNAGVFHQKWGVWPMTGWLAAFESMGLIQRDLEQINRLRSPTLEEVKSAARDDSSPF